MFKLKLINKPKTLKLKSNFKFPDIILANLQEKIIEPLIEKQTIEADSSYDGLSKVTINAVTNNIDSNIKSTNIKKGVSILNVNGKLTELIPQTKQVTPEKEIQIVTPDSPYTGLTAVQVNSIPEDYIIPNGELNITENGNYDVKNYDSANVNIGGSDETEELITFTDIDKYSFCPTKAIINKAVWRGREKSIPGYLLEGSMNTDSYKHHYFYDIQEIVIPDDTLYINTSAFSKLPNLRTINLPDGLKELGNSCFDGSTRVEITSLPDSIELIGSYCFKGCSKLTLTKFPSSLKTIDNAAFQDCKGLTNPLLNEGLEKIGNMAFQSCGNLQLDHLPDTLVNLGSSAFYGCDLRITEIPAGITIINSSCLASNKNITELTIKGNVTKLGNRSLADCSSLSKFVLENVTKVPTLEGAYVFAGTPIYNGTGYIYVPDALVEDFKIATNWSALANQIKGLSGLEVANG